MTTNNTKYEEQQRLLCSEAAWRILEELEARGFTTDETYQVDGLQDKITKIIIATLRGDTNYCVSADLEFPEESVENDLNSGWTSDLRNQ